MSDAECKGARNDFDLATAEYYDIVRQCADQDLSLELTNKHIEHASILFNAALRHTRRGMDILTGTMPELFLEKIGVELKSALDRGISVRIIVIKPIIESLRQSFAPYGGIKIFQVPEEIRPEIARDMPHFYVSDDRRYRLEFKHDIDKDFEKHPDIDARANFNQPDVVSKLRRAFNDLMDACDPVPLGC